MVRATRTLGGFRWTRPRLASGLALALLGAAAMTTGAWWAFAPTGPVGQTEVTIVARDLRFDGANPVITVARGSAVRLTVRNEEPVPGLAHTFAIPSLGVRSATLRPGEAATLEFRAGKAGTFTYWCTLHPGLMDGVLQVVEQP